LIKRKSRRELSARGSSAASSSSNSATTTLFVVSFLKKINIARKTSTASELRDFLQMTC
jgi:hypothetical protein